MTRSREVGEPVSIGRRDLRATHRRAFADALFAAGSFTLVVIVNGLVVILAIGLLQIAGR